MLYAIIPVFILCALMDIVTDLSAETEEETDNAQDCDTPCEINGFEL